MPDLCIVADDYGLGDGHDRVMRQLLETGAIDAVSVLVEWCSEASAAALREMRPADARVGLHLNFTFAPPGAPLHPDRTWLLLRSLAGLDGAEVAARISTQMDRFRQLFGRLPDFVDGHEHCHAFPGIRPAVIEMVARHGIPVRSMVPLTRPGDVKGKVIAHLGRAVQNSADRADVPTNWRFGGVLPIPDPEAAVARLGADLADARRAATKAPGEIWFMVHPGDADDPVQVPGHPARLRALEAALLRDAAPGFAPQPSGA